MGDPTFPPMSVRVRQHAAWLLEDPDRLGMDQEADGVLGELIDSIISPEHVEAEFGLDNIEELDRGKFLAAIVAGNITIYDASTGDPLEDAIRALERFRPLAAGKPGQIWSLDLGDEIGQVIDTLTEISVLSVDPPTVEDQALDMENRYPQGYR